VDGYDWCKGQGAEVIFTTIPEAGEALKSFAQLDWIPILNLSAATLPQIEPPGWVFCFDSPSSYQAETLLHWISENDWDYAGAGRRPKIGFVGWDMSYDLEVKNGMIEYCQAHTDQFEYVGGYLTPPGTTSWTAEVEALKDCDYVCLPSVGIAASTFASQFRAYGYMATFIGTDALAANQGLLVDTCGWAALDGMLTAHSTRWWNESYPIVDLAETLLQSYHPAEEEDIKDSGLGYIGGSQQAYLFFDILRQAIENVGAQNFNGQAFYDAATGFQTAYEGLPEWGFSATARFASKDIAIYEWSAAYQDLIVVSDWLPIIIY
jgi:hypothetical protein